jgi:hypothetical protein
MLPFTKSDAIYLASALVADNDVTAVLEPATGAVSLESNAYEDFVVEVSFDNKVASAGSVSVQFYKKATNDGDVSATWTAVGAPIVVAIAASVGGSVSAAKKHSREFGSKYVSAIATLTFADQNAATYASASLRGELKRRDI